MGVGIVVRLLEANPDVVILVLRLNIWSDPSSETAGKLFTEASMLCYY